MRTYVQSHAHDPDGWYLLHLELEHAGEVAGSDVALARALAIDHAVPARFSIVPAPPPRPPAELDIPGYHVLRKTYSSPAAALYEATAPSGTRCVLRVLSGRSADSIGRIMEHQQLTAAYPRCIPISQIVQASDGTPVQVLPWSYELPIDAQGGRLLAPQAARKAIASIAQALGGPHRDGLIAGDLRPCAVFGRLDQPDSLRILGLRRAIDGSFGMLAADVGRFRWYATEEGAECSDPRTDIYGLGLLLWWIAVGREPPPLDRRLKHRMPETGDAALDRIIARCTQVRPADRYPDVDALIRDLSALEPPHAGPWVLGDRIGGGTGADVYRATHATDGRAAVVKIFTRRRSHERERAALAAATVPGVVHEIDASASDIEQPYIAFAPARGESLAHRLARGPMAPAVAMAIVRQLAAIMAGVHRAGVIHRDLTPASIFVAFDKPTAALAVTVIDFDAASVRGRPELDESELIGTPPYMAPEQWELVPDVDERADVYPLGLVWYECITGHHPLTADSLIGWQRAHLDATRPKVRHPGLAPHHAALIEAMIAHDRERRPRTMSAVLAALDAPPPPSPVPPAPPKPRRDRYAITALVAGLAGLVTGILGIVAIAFAALSKRRIENSRGALVGDDLATAGLVLGIIDCTLLVAVLFVLPLVRFFVAASGG